MSESLAEVMDLVQKVQRGIHRSKVVGRGNAPWHVMTDLTMAQLRALMTIQDSGHLTVGQLAERLGTGMPAASSIVDRLVEEELAERRQDPTDRRRIVVTLSAQGSARVDAMRQGPKEVVEALLSRLEPDELAALIRGLRGFARAADELAAEAEQRAAEAPAGKSPVTAH
ncbi:MAG: MarR family winged helix-turn-helix transcriptional regulator [Candidatus Dormibacteraceae bacterium]